jgi:uncharacterized protein (TIGR02147 family)
MLAQEALQKVLMANYCELKSRNGAYSLRAYARRLDMNSGILSSILNGKRRLSAKQIGKIANQLELAPPEQDQIDALIGAEKVLKKREANTTLTLRSDQFYLISDGIHYSILALMETDDFESNADWMADRLNESPARTKAALERLERLRLVEKKKGAYHLLHAQTTTTDGVPDSAIRKYHEDRLEEAKVKLRQTEVEDRDLFSSTLAINRSQLPLARTLIRDFKKKLAKALEQGTKDEVYRISFQLYPVTRLKKRKNQ